MADLRTDRAQSALLAAHAAQLARARDAAEANYAAGRLDWPTYLVIRANSLAADTALLALDQNTRETAIALDALVGTWPDASLAEKRSKALVHE
jgi:outer membrane protein TolC